MKYTIYQITNTLNGKIYIGKHQTENINDGYFGSGTALRDAIKKYGKQHFSKEVLFVFDNEAEMNQKERELITEEFVQRQDTYNLGVGGEGGPHFKGKTHSKETIEKMVKNRVFVVTDEYRKKRSEINKNRVLSDIAKKNISNAAKKPKSEETKNKLRDAYAARIVAGYTIHRNVKLSDDTKRKISNSVSGEHNPMFGKTHSAETRQKISDAMKGKPSRQVECPFCKKTGAARIMPRYHFDNCKHKNGV